MSLQPLFRRFHENIQLKNFDENAELREKRDRVLDRLRQGLKAQGRPTFEWFNQGSYAMGTGIRPLSGDYDIDVGIVFNGVYTGEYDPVEVKGWVYEAVRAHTARVDWRRPCITVYYQQSGELKYHVDLAIFAQQRYRNQLCLAIGKQHSAANQREWQPDDRKGFMEDVKNRFSGEDGFQFRRVIRYLKRWKDEHFASHGYAAPSGLALTVAAYSWFRPRNQNDLAVTHDLVRTMLSSFTHPWSGARRLSLRFPRAPHDDVFERMTDQQMQEFHQRLVALSERLDEARSTHSPEPLQRAFGDDFPSS